MKTINVFVVISCLSLTAVLLSGCKKPNREVENTIGLIKVRVCIDDVSRIILERRKAIVLSVSYVDLWSEKKTDKIVMYNKSVEQFIKGDSLSMYLDPLKPGKLKYTAILE